MRGVGTGTCLLEAERPKVVAEQSPLGGAFRRGENFFVLSTGIGEEASAHELARGVITGGLRPRAERKGIRERGRTHVKTGRGEGLAETGPIAGLPVERVTRRRGRLRRACENREKTRGETPVVERAEVKAHTLEARPVRTGATGEEGSEKTAGVRNRPPVDVDSQAGELPTPGSDAFRGTDETAEKTGGERIGTQGEDRPDETVADGGRQDGQRDDGRRGEKEDLGESGTVAQATGEIEERPCPRSASAHEGERGPEGASPAVVPRGRLGVGESEPRGIETNHETVGVGERETAPFFESPEDRAHVAWEKRQPVAPVGEFDRPIPGGDLAPCSTETRLHTGDEDPGGEPSVHGQTRLEGGPSGGRGDPPQAERTGGEGGGERSRIFTPPRRGLEEHPSPPRAAAGEVDAGLEPSPTSTEVGIVLAEAAEREGGVGPETGRDVGSDNQSADTAQPEIGHRRRVGPEPDPEESACAARGAEGEESACAGTHDPGRDGRADGPRGSGENGENAPRTVETREQTDGEARPTSPCSGMGGGGFLTAKKRPGEFGRPGALERADLGDPRGGRRGRSGGGRRPVDRRPSARRQKESKSQHRPRPQAGTGREAPPIRSQPPRLQTSSRMRMALPVSPRR